MSRTEQCTDERKDRLSCMLVLLLALPPIHLEPLFARGSAPNSSGNTHTTLALAFRLHLQARLDVRHELYLTGDLPILAICGKYQSSDHDIAVHPIVLSLVEASSL